MLLQRPRSASPVRILAWRAHTRATGADAAAHRRHMWRRLVPCRCRRERRSCFSRPPGAPPPSVSSRGARTRAPQEQTLPPVVGTCGDDWSRAAAVVTGAHVPPAPQEHHPHPHPRVARAHVRHRSRRCRPSSAHVATTGAVPCRCRRDRRSCCSSAPRAPPQSASSRGSRTRAPQKQTLPPIVGTCGDDWCRAVPPPS